MSGASSTRLSRFNKDADLNNYAFLTGATDLKGVELFVDY
jgi:hypothetical protein